MSSIGVLGGGPWGIALARAARRAGSAVTLCTRREHADTLGGMTITDQLATLAASARIMLIAVPSDRVRSIARELGDHLDGGHLLVHGIRGLSGDELAPISQILREETPVRRLGALGGPVQADELNQGQPSAMVVASEFPDVTRAVRDALSSKWLNVYGTGDLCGLEWASAMVGCLSIGVGFAQARADVSPGLMAALISRAVDEAAGIAVAAGASERTLYGLGGYGDLIASMTLPDRPDVVLGRELAGGATLEQARDKARLRVEAIELVPRVIRFARRQGVTCDIFAALDGIIQGQTAPEDLVSALFAA